LVEPPLKYHPAAFWRLTGPRDPGPGPCLAGSLTGAVASQSVTEARDGGLRPVGHRLLECKGTSPPDCERDGASRDESRP
jgi:hypothetical protein